METIVNKPQALDSLQPIAYGLFELGKDFVNGDKKAELTGLKFEIAETGEIVNIVIDVKIPTQRHDGFSRVPNLGNRRGLPIFAEPEKIDICPTVGVRTTVIGNDSHSTTLRMVFDGGGKVPGGPSLV